MPPKRLSPLKAKKPEPDPIPPRRKLKKAVDVQPEPEPDFIPPPRKKVKAKEAPVVVKSNGTNTAVVIQSNGTNVMGIPVLMEPVSPNAVLNNLVCREIIDPSGPLEPLSPTVTTLQDMVSAMSKGTDIAPFKDHIQRVASNQPEKGDVIRAYVNQIEHEMIADLTVMRANSMRVIKRASARNDVSVSEALVVWRMCNEQLPDLKKGLGGDKAVDSVTVVEKIDYARQQAERISHHQWEGTTPQGRELIRKKLWEVKKEVLAKQAAENLAKEGSKPS